jgi:hypothetical protein
MICSWWSFATAATDRQRSDMVDDSGPSSFTPLFAINFRGVHLFAAPYAKRLPLDGDLDVTPAASSEGDVGE